MCVCVCVCRCVCVRVCLCTITVYFYGKDANQPDTLDKKVKSYLVFNQAGFQS